MRIRGFNYQTAIHTGAAIVERALLGAVTFLVTILIGRWGGPDELGVFAIFFPLVFVAIALQESLITAPYTVFAVNHTEPNARRRYLGSVLTHSNFLSGILAAAFAVAAAIFAWVGNASYAWTSAVLALTVPCVLLREFARRIVYAELKPEAAVAISGGVGLLQLLMMAALFLFGQLTAASAFFVMGLSSLIGSCIWLFARRDSIQFRGTPVGDSFRQNWTLGKWSVATQVGEIVRTQMFPWLLALAADERTVGVYAACAVVAALPTPLHVALSNLLIPQFVHTAKQGGFAAANRLMWQATGWLTAAMAVFCTAVAIIGGQLIVWIYGKNFGGFPDVGKALVLLALSQLLNGASLPSQRALFALQRAQEVFTAQIIGILVNLALGVPMVYYRGIVGAAYASLIGSALKAGLGAWWYAAEIKRWRSELSQPPVESTPEEPPLPTAPKRRKRSLTTVSSVNSADPLPEGAP